MSAPLDDKTRAVLPRWRDLGTTLSSGELDFVRETRVERRPDIDFLSQKIRDWEAKRTVPFAADAVGAAFVLGRGSEATDAAEFLLSRSSDIPQATLDIAARVLIGPKGAAENSEPEETDVQAIRGRIHSLRKRLHDEPANAFLWVELARRYASLGFNEQGGRAIQIALYLAPNNRFVLRAAARFFHNGGDARRAHDALKASEVTRRDPWLLAAELAVAPLAGRTSSFVKGARSLLAGGGHSAFQLTELASSLATLELESSNTRVARRLFRQSVEDPNDNSVAQARWASQFGVIEVDERLLETPRSYEARSWHAYQVGQWQTALSEAWLWLKDQPFSSSPAIHGSYTASVFLQDHQEATRIALAGLRANRRDPKLLNNLVFSLANEGRLDSADEFFDAIDPSTLDDQGQVVHLATSGLLRYRRGDIAAGRGFYLAALEKAAALSLPALRAMAALFFAGEEARARSPQATEIIRLALDLGRNRTEPDVRVLTDRLKLNDGLHGGS